MSNCLSFTEKFSVLRTMISIRNHRSIYSSKVYLVVSVLFFFDQTILLRGFKGGLKGWKNNEI